MRKILAFTMLSFFCVNSYGAERVPKNLAIEYLKLSRVEEIINASIREYETKLFPNAKQEDKAKLHVLFVNSMGWDTTKDQLANMVMNLYTKEEIEAWIAFMKSPLGASAMAKSEVFSRQYSAMLSANMRKVIAQCCTNKQ